MQPFRTQLVTKNSTDVAKQCLCEGLVPCYIPPELNFGDQFPCRFYNQSNEPSNAVSTPPINENSYFYAQFYAPFVNITKTYFNYFIYSCIPGENLTISIILDDTNVPWPNNTGLLFTWENKPNSSTVDILILENFTCPSSGSFNLQFMTTNLGPIITASRRVGVPTFTLVYTATGTLDSFRIAAPFGYNLTISSGRLNSFGVYCQSRYGYTFDYNFGYYYTNESIILTDKDTYDTFPIGYKERGSFNLSFTDFLTFSNFTTTSDIVPAALAVPPLYPIMGSIYVLNLNKLPSNPSFYNEQALIDLFEFGGPAAEFTPYGICVAQTYYGIANFAGERFCSMSNYAIVARLSGPVDSRGISSPIIDFPVYRQDNKILAEITVQFYPYYVTPDLEGYGPVYPIENLRIRTNSNHIYGTGSFFIWLFVVVLIDNDGFGWTIDNLGTVTYERSSNPTEVFISVYPVNTSPDLNTTTQYIETFTNTSVSSPIEITNFDNDGYSSGIIVTAPLIGNVTFNITSLTWTYTPRPSLNSVDDLNGTSDMFSFYVKDNSTSPCDQPLPAYTTSLVNPVLNCTNTSGCGQCPSGIKTVYVFVAPVYCQPGPSNISKAIITGFPGTVPLVIDNLVVTLFGCSLANVTITSPTQAGVVTVVSAVAPTFVFAYSLTNITFSGNDTFSYNVTTNQHTWAVGHITIEVLNVTTSSSMSSSPSKSDSRSHSNSPSVSASDSRSNSPSISASDSRSASRSLSPSISGSNSKSNTPSASGSNSRSNTPSASGSDSRSNSPSISASDSRSASYSRSSSQSITPTISLSDSQSVSPSVSLSDSRSTSYSNSQSRSPSDSQSRSHSSSSSDSRSSSQSDSRSQSISKSTSDSSSHSQSESHSESDTTDDTNKNTLNGGELAGIVMGSTLFLILLAILVVVCISAKKSIKYATL